MCNVGSGLYYELVREQVPPLVDKVDHSYEIVPDQVDDRNEVDDPDEVNNLFRGGIHLFLTIMVELGLNDT